MPVTRSVKKYRNRKLYDSHEKRYVSLREIAAMIRKDDEVSVIDDDTKRDITGITLAQIIADEERRRPHLAIEALRKLIQSGGSGS